MCSPFSTRVEYIDTRKGGFRMTEFYARASREGYVVGSSGQDHSPLEELDSVSSQGEHLGRLAVGRFLERPLQRRLVVGGALATVAIATTAAIALSIPGGSPGIGGTRGVTLEAVTESGRPYQGDFTVRVYGPGGVTEDIFADLPKTRVDLFNGDDTLETNQGSWPAADPGGNGIFNESELDITSRTRTVTVVVPGIGQYASGGNAPVTTNTNPQGASQNQSS
jgi:hypothetical protein